MSYTLEKNALKNMQQKCLRWLLMMIELWVVFNVFFSFLVAQTVKHLPAMRETRVRFLGREDPLEKEMAPHSSTLAWKIPWTEEPDRLQSMGSLRVRHDWATSPHFIQPLSQGLTENKYSGYVAGNDWGQKEKRASEAEMARWHHW